jgi:hypothetical protein
MRRLVPVLLAIGCNHDAARDAVVAPAQMPASTDASTRARGAPHAGTIREVTVTDDGGAALTLDDADTVRLWPVLDCTREPIPVVAPAPAGVALLRDGDSVVAALLDDAGSAHVLRFARGGAPAASGTW